MTAIEELELTLEPTRLVSEGRVNSRPGTARNSRESASCKENASNFQKSRIPGQELPGIPGKSASCKKNGSNFQKSRIHAGKR
jgi:hypothetical protein